MAASPQEIPKESLYLRAFGKLNLRSPRESIGDNDLWWCENAIPVAPGNVVPTQGPGGALVFFGSNETGLPTYSMTFNAGGVDYIFAVWSNSGNAYVGAPVIGATWTKIGTALFGSGKTQAIQWNNQGILIIDPAGYWDWNVTAGATLTSLSNSIQSLNIVDYGIGYASAPTLAITGGGGTGATATCTLFASAVTVVAAGTNYLVGDVLTVGGGGGGPSPNVQVTVTAIGGGGVITGIVISAPGAFTVTAGAGSPLVGGHGSGATATVIASVGATTMTSRGSNYTAQPTITPSGGTPTRAATFTANLSGFIGGTSIASYAGRAWIASGRTISVTDAGTYASFIGSGTSFTINDSTLHNNITALFTANSYLYIFGDESVDILSNVSIVAGTLQFSRVNVSASIGTNQPQSIFAYFRSVYFANSSGFYRMSGATPEKISDDLDLFMEQVSFGIPIYGGQVMVGKILCAAFLVTFTDIFTLSPSQVRSILALYSAKTGWFFDSQPPTAIPMQSILSVPVNGVQSLFGWFPGAFLHQLFATTSGGNFLLMTKLWDGGDPVSDTQSLRAGVAANYRGLFPGGIRAIVDTEVSTTATQIAQQYQFVQWKNNAGAVVSWQNNLGATVQWFRPYMGYNFLVGDATSGKGKYAGITLMGISAEIVRVQGVGLEFVKTGAKWTSIP